MSEKLLKVMGNLIVTFVKKNWLLLRSVESGQNIQSYIQSTRKQSAKKYDANKQQSIDHFVLSKPFRPSQSRFYLLIYFCFKGYNTCRGIFFTVLYQSNANCSIIKCHTWIALAGNSVKCCKVLKRLMLSPQKNLNLASKISILHWLKTTSVWVMLLWK